MNRSLRVANMMVAALVRSARLTADSRAADLLVSITPRKSLILEHNRYAISYLEAGDPQGQLVVFVHGTPGEAAHWIHYLSSVPSGLCYIALDRPGFGESGPDDAITSLAEQATAVSAVIRARKRGPATLVGHSLGGSIAIQTAVDAPQDVASVVVLSGSFDPTLQHTQLLQQAIDNWPAHVLLPRRLRNANRELLAIRDELETLRPRLGDVFAPVTILHGLEDDLVPAANADFLKARLIRARSLTSTLLDGHGHFLHWKSKQHVIAAIAESVWQAKSPVEDT